MGLLDSIIGSVLGGSAGQQQGGGANPLLSILMSFFAARAGGRGRRHAGQRGGSGLGGVLGGAGGTGGRGGTIDSWIGQGQNRPIAPHDLGAPLGPETVGQLSRQTEMGSSDLLSQRSQLLPGVVDQFTPHGHPPTEQEHAGWQRPSPAAYPP